jgi:hypothetical protein
VKSLFPEMEKEIRYDRNAEKRERVQRAREWLKNRDITWLINHLLEIGPMTEHALMSEAINEEYHLNEAFQRGLGVGLELIALWTVGKLWRRKLGIHPCSGEETYVYGVRGVHKMKKSA